MSNDVIRIRLTRRPSAREIAGIFNSIPHFGPLLVTAGLSVGSLHFGTIGMTAAVAGVSLLITTLESSLLTPMLMGRASSMVPASSYRVFSAVGAELFVGQWAPTWLIFGLYNKLVPPSECAWSLRADSVAHHDPLFAAQLPRLNRHSGCN